MKTFIKKTVTLAAIGLTALLPFSSTQAQTVTSPFWTALAKTSSLENAKALESIYGSFEIDNGGEHFAVNYHLNANTTTHQMDSVSSRSQVTAQVTVENLDTADAETFKKIDVVLKGQLINLAQKDLYLRLDDVIINTVGSNTEIDSDIADFQTMIEPMKGHWYHMTLSQLKNKEMAAILNQSEFVMNFRQDPKKAIRDAAEAAVREQVKQNQYYNSIFENYDAGVLDTTDPVASLGDYQSYLTDEVKQHPIDLKGLVQKGVLTCDSNILEGQTLEAGFQYPDCWPSIYYNDSLTEEESALVNELYANAGVWIYENGNWYYVNTGVTKDGEDNTVDYSNIVSQEEFDYDETAIESEVAKYMQGVDLLLNANFLNERDIISGPNQGSKFFNLNRGVAAKTIKNFGVAIGERLSAYDENELRSTLGKIGLGGLYYIRPDNGLLESLYAKLKVRNESLFKNFELNYKYKLMDHQTKNQITAPSEALELDELMAVLDK